MKKTIILMCTVIPLMGFTQNKIIDNKEIKSIIFAFVLFVILFIGALFKTFLILRDREREKATNNSSRYGEGYDV